MHKKNNTFLSPYEQHPQKYFPVLNPETQAWGKYPLANVPPYSDEKVSWYHGRICTRAMTDKFSGQKQYAIRIVNPRLHAMQTSTEDYST